MKMLTTTKIQKYQRHQMYQQFDLSVWSPPPAGQHSGAQGSALSREFDQTQRDNKRAGEQSNKQLWMEPLSRLIYNVISLTAISLKEGFPSQGKYSFLDCSVLAAAKGAIPEPFLSYHIHRQTPHFANFNLLLLVVVQCTMYNVQCTVYNQQ